MDPFWRIPSLDSPNFLWKLKTVPLKKDTDRGVNNSNEYHSKGNDMYDSDITSESPARKKIRLSNKSDADGEAIPKNHELLVAVTAQHADKIKSEHYEKPSEILTPRGDIGAEDDEVGKDVWSASKFRNSYSSDSDTDGEEVADFADTSSANPDQDAGVSATESAKKT
ncbi:hypothetical protein L207DRAFT_599740 [Hyaloscypha variabilis F]|uniref:Uncharacterized protein n=1 Tax=Hyaloscypha variabilis (strain UAMH 11265 / GT02V1 / F) TaxID=1149755 RepID=A0A2J6RFJ5_HYAVF|nr:hypothetical protein L207DRAFT_599740 [Hyaloscypha variabilis F]